MVELKTPNRYRRHDVVRAHGRAALTGRRARLLPASAARSGARASPHAPNGAARRPGRLDPRRARRMGGRVRERARHDDAASRPHWRLGLVPLVYTVNSERRMRELAELGVAGIFTDRPERALRAISGRSSLRSSSAHALGGKRRRDARADRKRERLCVGTSAIRSTPGPTILRRVTGPRNVCVTTSPTSVFAEALAPFATIDLDRLRPDQHEHALAARALARRVDPQRSRRRARPAARRRPCASSRFIVPMNSATKGVAGAP